MGYSCAEDVTGDGAADLETFSQVAFQPMDIFSKWGFADGDLLDDLLDVWLPSAGFSIENGDWLYVNSHLLLWEAYARFVARPGSEPVMFVSTSHNPVRARRDWDERDRSSGTPAADAPQVLVPTEQLSALCAELFPLRSRGWMNLHHAFSGLQFWPGLDPELFGPPDLPPGAGADRLRMIVNLTDRTVSTLALDEDERLAVAMLLRSLHTPDRGTDVAPETLTRDRLADLVSLCRAALSR